MIALSLVAVAPSRESEVPRSDRSARGSLPNSPIANSAGGLERVDGDIEP
jgi:hypothetical protein